MKVWCTYGKKSTYICLEDDTPCRYSELNNGIFGVHLSLKDVVNQNINPFQVYVLGEWHEGCLSDPPVEKQFKLTLKCRTSMLKFSGQNLAKSLEKVLRSDRFMEGMNDILLNDSITVTEIEES